MDKAPSEVWLTFCRETFWGHGLGRADPRDRCRSGWEAILIPSTVPTGEIPTPEVRPDEQAIDFFIASWGCLGRFEVVGEEPGLQGFAYHNKEQ